MKPQSTDDVFELLEGAFTSAALGAAFELGLFHFIREKPHSAEEIARKLKIPGFRCRYWIQMLEQIGLIQETPEGLAPTPLAHTTIIEAHDPRTWAFLAREARERLPAIDNLPAALHDPGSNWTRQGIDPPDYFEQILSDHLRAQQFTRMLYDIHRKMADELADLIELGHAMHMVDIAGGSGVMSFALLRKYPAMKAVVLDTANVCAAGREIAAENHLQDRVSYMPVDLLADVLPPNFDLALKCDVGLHQKELYWKIHECLKPGGRLVIIDLFAKERGVAPPTRAHWALQNAMHDPNATYRTADEIESFLQNVGFTITNRQPFSGEWTLIDACRERGESLALD